MNKLKKLDYKKVLKVFSLLAFLGIIVLTTAVNLGLSTVGFNFYTWLSNTMILVGIMIFGLLMGESIGDDIQMNKVDGLYQKNLKDFNQISNDISSITIYFSQFYNWYKKQQLRDKKLNYLINHNVDGDMAEDILKYVKIEHLVNLKNHALMIKSNDDKEIFIEKQGDEQIAAIEDVLLGKVQVDSPTANYFLMSEENANCKSELEVSKQLDKAIKVNKNFNRAFKITVSLIISIIWCMLSVNDFMDVSDVQAWVNLVSRIFALFTSLLSGWMGSVTDVKLKAGKIKNKYVILSRFKTSYESQEFVPISSSDLAKLHFEEYQFNVKKQEEEEKKAWETVVDIAEPSAKKLTGESTLLKLLGKGGE